MRGLGRISPQFALADNFALYPRRSINRLRDVQRLRETAAVNPINGISDFKAGVLDSACHPVVRAGSSKCQKMSAWFQNPQALSPELNIVGDARCVPLFSHEAEFIGRVGDDGINAVFLKIRQFVEAISVDNLSVHYFKNASAQRRN